MDRGRASRRIFATLGAIALVALHLAPGWLAAFEPGPVLLLGLLPAELAYRLAWMAAALLYLVLLTRGGEAR